MKALKERTALITGGGRGIGAATALALGKAGVSVAVVARNEEQVVDVAARLRQTRYEAFAFPCDVTNSREVREVSLAAREAMGRVDILVNSAGTFRRASTGSSPRRRWPTPSSSSAVRNRRT